MLPLSGSMKKTEIRTLTLQERPRLLPEATAVRERLPFPSHSHRYCRCTRHPGTPDNLLAREQGPSEAPNPISDLGRYFSLLCHRGHLAHVWQTACISHSASGRDLWPCPWSIASELFPRPAASHLHSVGRWTGEGSKTKGRASSWRTRGNRWKVNGPGVMPRASQAWWMGLGPEPGIGFQRYIISFEERHPGVLHLSADRWPSVHSWLWRVSFPWARSRT